MQKSSVMVQCGYCLIKIIFSLTLCLSVQNGIYGNSLLISSITWHTLVQVYTYVYTHIHLHARTHMYVLHTHTHTHTCMFTEIPLDLVSSNGWKKSLCRSLLELLVQRMSSGPIHISLWHEVKWWLDSIVGRCESFDLRVSAWLLSSKLVGRKAKDDQVFFLEVLGEFDCVKKKNMISTRDTE